MYKLFSRRAGFSLLETTIVLGVASLVIAGLWLVISTIYDEHRESRLTAQVEETVANARRIFGKSSELPNVSGTANFTTASIAAGIFPADTVRDATTVIHALGSNMYLAYAVSGTPVLNLTIAGMQPNSCTYVATKLLASKTVRDQYGIVGFSVTGGSGLGNTLRNLDVPVSTLVTACNPRRRGTQPFSVTFQFTIL